MDLMGWSQAVKLSQAPGVPRPTRGEARVAQEAQN